MFYNCRDCFIYLIEFVSVFFLFFRAAFHLNVSNVPVQNDAGQKNKCQQQVVVCSRYLGSKHEESNMALIEIGFVSGFEVDKASLNVRNFRRLGIFGSVKKYLLKIQILFTNLLEKNTSWSETSRNQGRHGGPLFRPDFCS
jgi:hypothetical protein